MLWCGWSARREFKKRKKKVNWIYAIVNLSIQINIITICLFLTIPQKFYKIEIVILLAVTFSIHLIYLVVFFFFPSYCVAVYENASHGCSGGCGGGLDLHGRPLMELHAADWAATCRSCSRPLQPIPPHWSIHQSLFPSLLASTCRAAWSRQEEDGEWEGRR